MDSALTQRLARLKLIGFDIDGVFTDGRFYLSDDGVESKCFNTQDGYGVRSLLAAGVHVAVVSGRPSGAVARRMHELDVRHVILGSKNKVADFSKLAQELNVDLSETAFVGDDVPDLELLKHVGVSFSVANGVDAVQREVDYVSKRPGGMGAVREICDLLTEARREAGA